ncbi:Hypothetical predicted protein, partial [Lynx pardinus]
EQLNQCKVSSVPGYSGGISSSAKLKSLNGLSCSRAEPKARRQTQIWSCSEADAKL